MNKEMKEKTIEAISRKVQSNDYCGGDCSVCGLECNYAVCGEIFCALIESGVIVPKFKIGQEVWINIYDNFYQKVNPRQLYISGIARKGYHLSFGCTLKEKIMHFYDDEIYSTEAEAQQALKDMK